LGRWFSQNDERFFYFMLVINIMFQLPSKNHPFAEVEERPWNTKAQPNFKAF